MPFNYTIYRFQCHYEAGTEQGLHRTGSVHIASEGRSMQCVQFVSFVFEWKCLSECIRSNHIKFMSSQSYIVFTMRIYASILCVSVCMNGLYLSRVFVTKFLCVHMDSKLDWIYHINITLYF